MVHADQPIGQIMSSIVTGLFEMISEDMGSEKNKKARDMVETAVKQLSNLAAEKEQLLVEAREKNEVLETKVNTLEKDLESAKRYALSTQIEMIKGNVMIRTAKNTKEVAEHVCTLIGRGGGPKPSPTSFYTQQISTDSPKDKTPKKLAKGEKPAPQQNLYKIHLGGKMKNELFKGLAAPTNTSTRSGKEGSEFQVSHDVPPFLYKQRNLLEKAAFSIRKENKDLGVRTKVTLKGFNLVLFVKTKAISEWVNIENDKVAQLRTSMLEAKEGDLTPVGDVNSLLGSLEKF